MVAWHVTNIRGFYSLRKTTVTMMFAGVHRESYRFAEERARRIVAQRERARNNASTATSLTASMSESTSTTIRNHNNNRHSYNSPPRPIRQQQEPPRRIVLNRLDSSSVYAEDSRDEDDDVDRGTAQNNTSGDVTISFQDKALQVQARQVQESIKNAISCFERLETELLLHEGGGHHQLQQDCLQAMARRVDHWERRLCDLASATRQNQVEIVQGIIHEFATLDAEVAEYRKGSLVNSSNATQLSPILEPVSVDSRLAAALDDDGTTFSI